MFLFIFAILVAYLLGSIPFGFLLGKLKGIDIRTVGSCNIGATNVTRTLGKKWGWSCFLFDASKGFFPPFLTTSFLLPYLGVCAPYAAVSVALITVLGHIFPIWLKFKGGKGVATIIGALMALSYFAVLIGLLVWVLTFFTSRYVSLASILMMIVLPFAYVIDYYVIHAQCIPREQFIVTFLLFLGLAVLSIIKHRSNIHRICDGTELKFSKKSKTCLSTNANNH